jgi:hypothetical protein
MLNRSVLGKNSDDVVVSIVTIYVSELVEEKRNTDHLSGFFVASLERLQDGAHVCAGYRPCSGCAQSRFVVFFGIVCVVRLESCNDIGDLQPRHLFLAVPDPSGKVRSLFLDSLGNTLV